MPAIAVVVPEHRAAATIAGVVRPIRAILQRIVLLQAATLDMQGVPARVIQTRRG